MKRWIAFLLAGIVLATAGQSWAQGALAPVARVNDQIITGWELGQRARMLELFGVRENTRAEAMDRLIDERLQLNEARRLALTLSEDELVAGEAEFAGRASLDRERFLAVLGQAGIDPATYRDFIRAGLLWRKVVGARIRPLVSLSQEDVDRRLATAEPNAGGRVLLSEILMRADTPATRRASLAQASEFSRMTDLRAFAMAARQFSTAPTRGQGGALPWIELSALPPEVARQVTRLDIAQVTPPITRGDTVAVYQLRGAEQVAATSPGTLTLDYARLRLPGGRSPEALANAAEIAGWADRCDDLYRIARDMPDGALERRTASIGDIPASVAAELSVLDPGEMSAGLTSDDGQTLIVLMLCSRMVNPGAELNRPAMQGALEARQLTGRSRQYLADLRANAHIQQF